MLFSFLLLATSAVALTTTTAPAACTAFPSKIRDFSSDFQQPEPPLIANEFKTSFIQHKWNQNLSHIMAGYLYNSPSQKLVRADEAYDGGLATSLFNYANVTDTGLVENTLTAFDNASKPDVWRGYVNSNYPLFEADFLVQNEAVFGGLVRREFVEGDVASGAIPVTVYVDSCGVVVGYDYFAPGLRTRVVTMFFNTYVGPVKI
ncbi:uncharacterized protein ACLA_054940 [Aspergillus clavatus NRRL 1]|uniref:Uncharacterized protein n=1 Tax=Aspergillus clavatus (strain ATCC 1007 / CBS 513.65 / DSM 816 / NCTC 3887 / NRRL 1 / QM 1276 / 107) TaxID=344612 RepID=A1C9C3_ASPCL|nr:uncharacterized protein ACLA_054940 [Aspergillus clavatus NRRL 1]EAW13447.1 conserved hypothetical protein [Aspergillus clavatus NRRL 1]